MKMRIRDIVVGDRFRKDFSGVAQLVESIRALGLLQPIGVTTTRKLLWGECRLKACIQLGWTEIPAVVLDDVDIGDPVAVEAAENMVRKDFSLSEAVAIKRALEPRLRAEAVERQRAGKPSAKFAEGGGGETRQKAAALTGFSHTTLAKAEEVVAAAEAEPAKYGKLLADMDRTGRANGVYRRLSNMRQAEKIRGEPPPLPRGPFRVIVADWPSAYEADSQNDPTRRGVLPYPTMTFEQICALPVPDIAHDDSSLWFWTNNLLLANGTTARIIDAWGFTPKTILTWDKMHFARGDWLRGQTEHAVLATRGSPVVNGSATPTILREARTPTHSRKPDGFYELILRICPAPPGSYCELFARDKRPGFVQWGDEAPRDEAVD